MVEVALWPRKILIAFIKSYQWCISPLLGQRCRFYPSCSQYGLEALKKYGAFKGGKLTVLRLLKCHPFHAGGVDLVP